MKSWSSLKLLDIYKNSVIVLSMNFTHRTITENMTIVFPKVGDAVEVRSYAGEVYRFGIYGTSPVIKIGRGARPVGIEEYVRNVLNLKVDNI